VNARQKPVPPCLVQVRPNISPKLGGNLPTRNRDHSAKGSLREDVAVLPMGRIHLARLFLLGICELHKGHRGPELGS